MLMNTVPKAKVLIGTICIAALAAGCSDRNRHAPYPDAQTQSPAPSENKSESLNDDQAKIPPVTPATNEKASDNKAPEPPAPAQAPANTETKEQPVVAIPQPPPKPESQPESQAQAQSPAEAATQPAAPPPAPADPGSKNEAHESEMKGTVSTARPTDLEVMFKAYMDEKLNTDQLEIQASKIAIYLFDEDAQFRPKLWELRNLVQERTAQVDPADESTYRIHLLESGIHQIAAIEWVRNTIKEGAIIGTIAGSIGLASGLHVKAPSAKAITGVAQRSAAAVASGAGKIVNAVSPSELAVSGRNVAQMFKTHFRTATIDERFARDLRAILQNRAGLIERLEFTHVEAMNITHAEQFATYGPTNLKNVEIAILDASEKEGYLAFRYKPNSPSNNAEVTYFRSKPMTDLEVNALVEEFAIGAKDPLVQIPATHLLNEQTRVPASRFNNSVRHFSLRAAKRSQNFDSRLATRRFVQSGSLMALGYALANRSDVHFSDAYMESLMTDNNMEASRPTSPEPAPETGTPK